MVTVVSRVPHHSVVKECVCKDCGATLQYVPKEVQSYTARDYGGGSDTYHYITCPDCASKVYVKGY